jgi:hypothetical protein
MCLLVLSFSFLQVTYLKNFIFMGDLSKMISFLWVTYLRGFILIGNLSKLKKNGNDLIITSDLPSVKIINFGCLERWPASRCRNDLTSYKIFWHFLIAWSKISLLSWLKDNFFIDLDSFEPSWILSSFLHKQYVMLWD